MKKFEKIVALMFSILLLIQGSLIETSGEYIRPGLQESDPKPAGYYFSIGKYDNESPYYQSERHTFQIKDQPVCQIKKSLGDIPDINIYLIIRKIRDCGFTSCFTKAILPTLTIRDKIFPFHSFL